MHLDFEVQRCTRRCAATERPLEPGELSYSLLEAVGADVVRKDYCSEAWTGPPPGALAWWKWRIPEPTAKRIKLAPNEVLLDLFDQLVDQHEQQDLRYVLTLLLIRRRVFRLELSSSSPHAKPPTEFHDGSCATMLVYCPKREATYEVPVATPDAARIDEIQQQLSELLIAGAE